MIINAATRLQRQQFRASLLPYFRPKPKFQEEDLIKIRAKGILLCSEDVWRLIFSFCASLSHRDPHSLHSLSCVCKYFSFLLEDERATELWSLAWNCYKQNSTGKSDYWHNQVRTAEYVLAEGLAAPRDLLRLLGTTGCMSCGKKAIRKVTWEFLVRYCMDCLCRETISDWRLVNECGLQKHDLEMYPSTEADVKGNYLQFYWRRMIESLFFDGRSIEEAKVIYRRKQEQMELERKQRLHEAKMAEKKRKREEFLKIDADERRKMRRTILLSFCLAANKRLTAERLAGTKTFERNVMKLASELQKSAFKRLLPKILEETRVVEEDLMEEEDYRSARHRAIAATEKRSLLVQQGVLMSGDVTLSCRLCRPWPEVQEIYPTVHDIYQHYLARHTPPSKQVAQRSCYGRPFLWENECLCYNELSSDRVHCLRCIIIRSGRSSRLFQINGLLDHCKAVHKCHYY